MSTTAKHTPVQFNLSSGRHIRLTLREWRELRMLISEGVPALPKPAPVPAPQLVQPDLTRVK